MSEVIDGGLTFSGTLQPPDVPADPTGDDWRGLTGATGATGATGPAGDASLASVLATGSTTPRTAADWFRDNLDPRAFGAFCDAQQYSFTATVSGTALSVNTAKFALTDVGSTICIAGAGAAGATHVTTIGAFIDTTHVTLSVAAPTALAAAVGTVVTWGAHDDTAFIQAALDRAANIGGAVKLYGISLISAPLLMRPLIAQGGTAPGPLIHFQNTPSVNLTSDAGGQLVAVASMASMVHLIYNSGLTGGIAPFHAKVSGVTLNGCGLATVGISSEWSMHTHAERNRISGVVTGIQVQGYGVAVIAENTIETATCIQLGTTAIPGGGDSLVLRNDLYPSNGSGACIGVDVGPWGGDLTIDDNTITRVQAAGTGTCYSVRLSGDNAPDASHEVRHVVIEANEFWGADVAVYGRSYAGSRTVWANKITGNHAYSTYGVLADLDHCDDFILSENFCNGVHLGVAAGPAITLNLCSRVRIAGNNAGNYSAGFIVGTDMIDCEVTDNTVQDVGQSGSSFAIVNLFASVSCVRNVVRGNHFVQTSGTYAQNGVFEHASVDFTIAVDNFFSGVATQYTKVGANSQMGTVVITGGTIAGITSAALANLTATGTVTIGANAAAGQNLFLTAATGTARAINYTTAGVNRWSQQVNSATETGANVGADVWWNRFSDAGGFIDTALILTRSTGILTIPNGMRVLSTSGPTWTAGTGAPATTQPKGSMWSRTDGAVGTTLYVSQGGGTWNAVAGV